MRGGSLGSDERSASLLRLFGRHTLTGRVMAGRSRSLIPFGPKS